MDADPYVPASTTGSLPTAVKGPPITNEDYTDIFDSMPADDHDHEPESGEDHGNEDSDTIDW